MVEIDVVLVFTEVALRLASGRIKSQVIEVEVFVSLSYKGSNITGR